MHKNPFQLERIYNVCILMPIYGKNKYLAKYKLFILYTCISHVTRQLTFKDLFEISSDSRH